MKQKIRMIFSFLLACQLFIITVYAAPVWPSDTGIQAEAGIVMDVDSGAVLFGQNIHEAYPPASITKILTALVVLEHCNLEDTVTFSETAMMSVEADSGNKLSLVAGDQLSVEDCLYAMLLISVNQAANALAEHTAGSISAFVDLMNEKLAELGCTESHFDNPSGLNGDTQYVSAYDMARIAQAAYNNPQLLTINSALTHTIAPTTNNPEGVSFRTEHRLLYTEDSSSQYYFPAAVAGKTGYLLAAGNTLVTYAESDGRRLVSVILKGQPRQYFVDGKELLAFGFRSFRNFDIAQEESRYVTGTDAVELASGTFQPDDLTIEPESVITLPLEATFADAELSLEELSDSDTPPERAVARLRYDYDGRTVGSAYLLAREGVTLVNSDDEAVTEPAADPAVNPNAASDAAQSDAPSDASADAPESHRSMGGTILIVVILLLAGLVAALIAWILYVRKKEAEALARRRALRRQRLMQSGDAEEFERLLSQRLEKNKK